MKRSVPLIASVFTFGSSAVYAASLTIPMAFEFLALDGRQVERSLVVHQDELELTPGYREIALRYYDMVETDLSDTPESVKSTAFIITLNAVGDAEYLLEPTGSEVRGGIIREPEEYAQSPEVVITRKDGGEVEYKFTQTDITQREFSKRLYGGGSASPAQATAVAAAPVAAATATSTAAPASQELVSTPVVAASAPAAQAAAPSAAAADNAATPAEMLQLWWQRADEQTRKDFLSWAIKQL